MTTLERPVAGPPMSRAEFDALFDRLRNWGRWGPDDELGALNHLGEAEAAAACRLVERGLPVSLGRPLDPTAGPDNSKPALHYMAALGDRGQGEPSAATDFVGVDFHGKSASHIDALCHMAYRGLLYNGRPAAGALSSAGATFAPITGLRNGVVARGVLLDAAAARGVEWIEPPAALSAEDLTGVAGALGVELRRGDVVLVRSGAVGRRSRLGAWNPDDASVGITPAAVELLAGAESAILGSDGDSDARPSPVEGVSSPVHALTLVALGMCLLDNLDLEAVSQACATAGRYEFLLVLAPLIVPGGTGSPLNPIAVF